MSKEAVGNGSNVLGSTEYCGALNQNTILRDYLSHVTQHVYSVALTILANRASAVIDQIYEDAQTHKYIMAYIAWDRRRATVDFVNKLGCFCEYAGQRFTNTRSCVSALETTSTIRSTYSSSSEHVLTQAVNFIDRGGSSNLSSHYRAATLKEAAQHGFSFAAGRDEDKKVFLTELAPTRQDAFFKDVYLKYDYSKNPWNYTGKNRQVFCSSSYIEALEREVFDRHFSSGWSQVDYVFQISSQLKSIARIVENDITSAVRSNDYVTDENAQRLRALVESLEHCGARSNGIIIRDIDSLAWYTPIDRNRVEALQQNMNRLLSDCNVKVDGVYGAKTAQALRNFIAELEGNHVQKITAVPLDSAYFGATLGNGVYDAAVRLEAITHGSFNNRLLGLGQVRATDKFIDTASRTIRKAATPNGYVQISRSQYDFLRQFQGQAKVVKTASKYLLVTGIALETLELVSNLSSAMQQADDKIDRATGQAIGGYVGSIAGSVGTLVASKLIFSTVGTLVGLAGLAGAPAVIITVATTTITCVLVTNASEWTGEMIGGFFAGNGTSDCTVDITELVNGG